MEARCLATSSREEPSSAIFIATRRAACSSEPLAAAGAGGSGCGSGIEGGSAAARARGAARAPARSPGSGRLRAGRRRLGNRLGPGLGNRHRLRGLGALPRPADDVLGHRPDPLAQLVGLADQLRDRALRAIDLLAGLRLCVGEDLGRLRGARRPRSRAPSPRRPRRCCAPARRPRRRASRRPRSARPRRQPREGGRRPPPAHSPCGRSGSRRGRSPPASSVQRSPVGQVPPA